MAIPKRIRRLVLPLALLTLLLGTTLGMVWHHHADSSASTDNCPICHLSHQAIDTPAAAVQLSAPVPHGRGPEPQFLSVAIDASPRSVPARGPPAA